MPNIIWYGTNGSGLPLKKSFYRNRPAGQQIRTQLAADRSDTAIREMHDHLLSFRIDYPNFTRSIRKKEFGLEVELCCSIGVRSHFDCNGRRTLVITAGIAGFNLSVSDKTDVWLQPSVRRQPESRLNMNFAKSVFPHEWPENILNLLLNARVARFRRRHDDVFSLNELMLPPIVGELFELLECHKRPGAHVFSIPWRKPPACDACQHAPMSHRLHVLISAELDARISAAAKHGHMSKHEWVRRAFEESLHREGPTCDPVARLAKLNAPTADIDQMLSEIAAGRC
jgi:hypothetical protein